MIVDFVTRLREQFIDVEGELPWAFGFDPQGGSRAELSIRRTFKPEELLAISKHNPFIKERNKVIAALPALGLTTAQLVKLTGLSRSTIFRIMAGFRKGE